jgi:hypothetical protein
LGLLRLLAHRIGLLREALPIGGDLQPRSLITLELGFLSLQPAFLCLSEILIGAVLGHRSAIGRLWFPFRKAQIGRMPKGPRGEKRPADVIGLRCREPEPLRSIPPSELPAIEL